METNVANLHFFFFWGIIKESRFLLGVIDIYSKYDRVVLIEDKRGEATIEDPQNILRFILKRNKIYVDKGFTLISNLRKVFSKRIKKYLISSKI